MWELITRPHAYVRVTVDMPLFFLPDYTVLVYSDQLHPFQLGDSDTPNLALCPSRKSRQVFAQGKSPWFLHCTFTHFCM